MARVAFDRNTFADVFVSRNRPRPPETSVTPENAAGRVRRAGFLLVVSGMSLLAISAGDTLADAAQRGFRGDELRGSVSDFVSGSGLEKVIHGTGGVDLLHGPSRGGKIVGGSGADEVYGGPGLDVLLGGSGDDFIEAKDGVGDFVGCGAGHDVASVDEKDRVAPDCETVYRA